jgi:hypothetical protein
MQASTTAAFGDVDVLNFGISTPSPKLSHVLITSRPSVRAVGRDVSPLPMRPAARPNLNRIGASNVP